MENLEIHVFVLFDGKESIAVFSSRTLAAEGFKKYAKDIQKSKRLKIKIKQFQYVGQLSKTEIFDQYQVDKF